MAKANAKADKFATLFDQDWKTAKSTIRGRVDERRTYDPTYSWDAKSDNPVAYSRLDSTLVPFQHTKPIVLSGSAVVCLENTTGFDAINVKQSSEGRSKIPLTVSQRDVGMAEDLSGKIPFYEEVLNSNSVPLMGEKESFKNMSMQAPELRVGVQPDFMQAAGSQWDQKLLNPKQRRLILEFDKQQKEATKLIQGAVAEREKTRKQLNGLQFKRGVLMFDSNDNPNSEIYGEYARNETMKNEYKNQIHMERSSRLATKQSAMQLNGNILVPGTLGPRVKVQPFYQSKGGEYHALSFDETYNRLFCRMGGVSNDARTQVLRDTDTSGKPYNITTHTAIEHWPPRIFERQIDKSLTHPSQASLEGSRNLQGSLRQN